MIAIDWRVWAALVVALLFGGSNWYSYGQGETSGKKEVTALWNADKLAVSTQNVALLEQNKDRTDKLLLDAENLRHAKDIQIDDLTLERNTALERVRKRPTARSSDAGLPVNSTVGPKVGATGADLAASDAEFLVWESTRKDYIRLQLIECQDKYESARKVLQQLKDK